MVLLVFIDGIGLGPLGAQNPFDGAPLEILAPLAHRPAPKGLECTFIDASLGHPGLPQSATGQAVIFTGEDAIAEAGGIGSWRAYGALCPRGCAARARGFAPGPHRDFASRNQVSRWCC